MIFDFINKCKNLFASKKIYADNNINLGRASENLSANNTMVVGHDCDANGNYSTALGSGSVVNYENQVVIGKYNFKRNSDYAFIIGNGTSDSDRSNALEVSWNGNLDVYRDLYVNGWIQSTKGIQSGQSIQSAIDVTCTGEGGVGTVSMRALNNNLINLTNLVNKNQVVYMSPVSAKITSHNLYGALINRVYVPTGWFRVNGQFTRMTDIIVTLPNNLKATANSLILGRGSDGNYYEMWLDGGSGNIYFAKNYSFTSNVEIQFISSSIICY